MGQGCPRPDVLISASPHRMISKSSPDSQGRWGAVLDVSTPTLGSHPPASSPTAGKSVCARLGRLSQTSPDEKRVAAVTWGQSHFQPAQLSARDAQSRVPFAGSSPGALESRVPSAPRRSCWKLLIAARGFNWEREHTDPIRAHEGAKGSRSGTNEGAIKPT